MKGNGQPVPGINRRTNPKVAKKGTYETQAEVFKRKKKELTRPKKNNGKAKVKKQSMLTSTTMKVFRPKLYEKAEERIKAESKPKPKIRYEDPNITLDELRAKAIKASQGSKGLLADPIQFQNAPIHILMKNYRRLSTDNPKYLDHYQLVFKIFKKQYDTELTKSIGAKL